MNWEWKTNHEYNCWELWDVDEKIKLCFITARPHYCNRGHYLGHIGHGISDKPADCCPHYYMKLETAKEEMKSLMEWRLQQIRAEKISEMKPIKGEIEETTQ